MKRLVIFVVTLGAIVLPPTITIAQTGKKQPPPLDIRYGPPKTLNDYFPFTPPKSREEWERRKEELRQQVLVANGLWPMPDKTPLNAVIHGKIDRDEYTVEKVFFASLPGHYVSGNLYRPKNKTDKLPAVLCPHGHWNNGRFYDAGPAEAKQQMAIGAEKTVESARFPLQARAAMLARMGCIVFFYDMVGYADSQQIKHREGFTDAPAELHLQSFMALQTWNSIRALDFVLGLSDVDPTRVGITGASGGGTQTFILGGIDDRLTAAFPAVMVSTAMQGGCVCENSSYFRIGTGNVELAGLFAPRPLAMSGADDWTVDIESKGLPQLKELYKLFGADDKIAAKAWREFKHNYNQPAREMMYAWFNKHFKLGFPEPIAETPFVPVPPKELSVYDAEHPLPKDATDAKGLRKHLTAASNSQLDRFKPKDQVSLQEFRRVYGTALRVMIGDTVPPEGAVNEIAAREIPTNSEQTTKHLFLRKLGTSNAVPVWHYHSKEFDDTVIIFVHPKGTGALTEGNMRELFKEGLKKKMAWLAVEPFLTGLDGGNRLVPVVDQKYAGFTFGYNRPVIGNRVDDILTAVAYARDNLKAKKIYLAGFEKAGLWVVLARALCGDNVKRCAADMDGFLFQNIRSINDENMLPGALKYGDMARLSALCAPGEMYLHSLPAGGMGDWLPAAYEAAKTTEHLKLMPHRTSDEKVLEWLMR